MMPLLLVLFGCHRVLEVTEPTCGEDYLSWGGGLTTYVSNGEGDGNFDYDPEARLIRQISGTYDMKTGTLYWYTNYISGYFIEYDHYVGQGDLWPNGDLDIEATGERVFDNGDRDVFDYRERRVGCDVTKRVAWSESRIEIERGTFEDGAYSYERSWREGGYNLTATGVREPDDSWQESMSYEKEILSRTYDEQGDDEGYVLRTFRDALSGVWIKAGQWERWRDGAHSYDFTYTSVNDVGGAAQQFVYDVDPSGDGSGRVTWGASGSCDVRVTDGACTKSNCTNGESGACF